MRLLLTSGQLAINLNAFLFIFFYFNIFLFFPDCCDVALEHINCSFVQANEYSTNSTCVYCPSTAIFATVSADSENVTAFVETGNVTDSPVNGTTMMKSSEFVNTTALPLLLVTNETIIYNTTKHFVSPAEEYFLLVLNFWVARRVTLVVAFAILSQYFGKMADR